MQALNGSSHLAHPRPAHPLCSVDKHECHGGSYKPPLKQLQKVDLCVFASFSSAISVQLERGVKTGENTTLTLI